MLFCSFLQSREGGGGLYNKGQVFFCFVFLVPSSHTFLVYIYIMCQHTHTHSCSFYFTGSLILYTPILYDTFCVGTSRDLFIFIKKKTSIPICHSSFHQAMCVCVCVSCTLVFRSGVVSVLFFCFFWFALGFSLDGGGGTAYLTRVCMCAWVFLVGFFKFDQFP